MLTICRTKGQQRELQGAIRGSYGAIGSPTCLFVYVLCSLPKLMYTVLFIWILGKSTIMSQQIKAYLGLMFGKGAIDHTFFYVVSIKIISSTISWRWARGRGFWRQPMTHILCLSHLDPLEARRDGCCLSNLFFYMYYVKSSRLCGVEYYVSLISKYSKVVKNVKENNQTWPIYLYTMSEQLS